MLALWEGVGRHHLHTWGPRPSVPQVAAGFPREAKGWAPRLWQGVPRPQFLCPWIPGGAIGVPATIPHQALGPLPQLVLSAEEQAGSDLSAALSRREAGSRSFPGDRRGLGNAGACWEAPGPPP